MATNFPTSLDTLINPLSTDNVNSPSHAAQHANANDAIEALEAKVGQDNSTVVTSHDYKITQLQQLVTSGSAGTKLIFQDVRNQSGSNLAKATPVYITGSEGASGKLLVSAASSASESSSSKTMGLTSSAISNNNNGQVVTEGILEGIDTTGAVDGDPVWLGVNGVKIYGLINKPSAPAHLVFLGIVIRGGQQNTGSMYVSIQNGFELHELHNVSALSPATGDTIRYNQSTGLWEKYTLNNFVTSDNLGNTLDDYVPIGDVGQPDGVASLDSTGKIPVAQLGNLIDGAPALLDTLNELAAAINDDSNYASTITTALGDKAPLASPALTGVPTAPTAAAGTNTTQIATTAYVQDSLAMAMALAL